MGLGEVVETSYPAYHDNGGFTIAATATPAENLADWCSKVFYDQVEYCHIEKLANLDLIPVPFGFWVSCFPVKIERGSAGWVRAVALVPETTSHRKGDL